MKTLEKIESLKKSWLEDPCWDIEDTEGFEDHREELAQFRAEHDAQCEKRAAEREAKIDKEAEGVGVKGLYRMILNLTSTIESLEHKIEELQNDVYRLENINKKNGRK